MTVSRMRSTLTKSLGLAAIIVIGAHALVWGMDFPSPTLFAQGQFTLTAHPGTPLTWNLVLGGLEVNRFMVPEPGTGTLLWAALGVGAVGAGRRMARRRRTPSP